MDLLRDEAEGESTGSSASLSPPRPAGEMSTSLRALVNGAVKRGKLKRAFNEEFAERLEEAFLEVTEKHVKRAAEENREAIEQSKAGLPEDAVAYLFGAAKPAVAA